MTGISSGTTTITVTTADGNKKATCDVTVFIPTIPVTGVSLNKTNLSLKPGDTEQLIAIVSPSNAVNKAVSWECSNTTVASISANGLVTGKTEGTATILVKTQDGNKTATCVLTVSNVITGTTGVLTWKLANGTLTISGTGVMPDYYNYSNGTSAPWYDYRESINSVIIENGVRNIGDYAFYSSYSNLKSVTIPNTVIKIGRSAFFYGDGLESITIPNSVIDIGLGAFYGCAFTTVIIPDNLKTIDGSIFYQCQFLHTLTIGASVASIGGRAFGGCRNLTKVFVKNPIPPTLTTLSGGSYFTFENSPIDAATLVVPKGSKAAYQSAFGWHNFGTIIEE